MVGELGLGAAREAAAVEHRQRVTLLGVETVEGSPLPPGSHASAMASNFGQSRRSALATADIVTGSTPPFVLPAM